MNKPGPYGPGCSEKVVSMLKAVFNDTDKNGGDHHYRIGLPKQTMGNINQLNYQTPR